MHNENMIRKYIQMALDEDLAANGDITTDSIIAEDSVSEAAALFKSDGVLAGIDFALLTFKILARAKNCDNIEVLFKTEDGAAIKKGETVLKISGPTRLILTAERTFLNILQRMSGIASAARRMAAAVKGFKAKIVDTRKTTPNFRVFEKAAVRIGGAFNHRFGLFDGVLIKDNHIEAAGSIAAAVEKARVNAHHLMKIEVEVKNIDEAAAALDAGADVIMLDNMCAAEMKKAVELIAGRALCEASGGIDENSAAAAAACGVDLISSGAITHSALPMDISLKIIKTARREGKERISDEQ
jgi:nicotinate-nucleotide pyrophosphorylase (carboxylating)